MLEEGHPEQLEHQAVRPLRNEKDYDWALEQIEAYFDMEPQPGTPEADRFDLLALVIADYEAHNWPIEPPEAPDALALVMQDRGLRQKDLAEVLGSKVRASEVLNRRRHLTLDHIWQLHKQWRIPAEILIKPYALRRRNRKGDAAGTETDPGE